jgi:hypothetical protein
MVSLLPRRYFARGLCAAALLFAMTACSTYKGYSGSACGWEEALVIPRGVVILESNGIEIPASAAAVRVLAGQNELLVALDSAEDAQRQSRPTGKLIMFARGQNRYTIGRRGSESLVCAWELPPLSEEPDYTRSYGCTTPSSR